MLSVQEHNAKQAAKTATQPSSQFDVSIDEFDEMMQYVQEQDLEKRQQGKDFARR